MNTVFLQGKSKWIKEFIYETKNTDNDIDCRIGNLLCSNTVYLWGKKCKKEKTAVEECSKSERRCFQGLERYEAEGFEKEKRTFRYAYFHKRQDEID